MELGNLHKSSRPENFSYPLLLEWFSNNPILPSSKYVLYILVLFLPVTLMIMPEGVLFIVYAHIKSYSTTNHFSLKTLPISYILSVMPLTLLNNVLFTYI